MPSATAKVKGYVESVDRRIRRLLARPVKCASVILKLAFTFENGIAASSTGKSVPRTPGGGNGFQKSPSMECNCSQDGVRCIGSRLARVRRVLRRAGTRK
ncbi:MAG TPA: hypothetical protein VMH04_24680 [Candidatus Solibacter sp.]|nr:hypothetical protein [Candidatus Solibacter sp.]